MIFISVCLFQKGSRRILCGAAASTLYFWSLVIWPFFCICRTFQTIWNLPPYFYPIIKKFLHWTFQQFDISKHLLILTTICKSFKWWLQLNNRWSLHSTKGKRVNNLKWQERRSQVFWSIFGVSFLSLAFYFLFSDVLIQEE